MAHNPTKLSQLVIISFSVFVQTQSHAEMQTLTPPKTTLYFASMAVVHGKIKL